MKYHKLLTDIVRIEDEDKKIAELDEGRQRVARAKKEREARVLKLVKGKAGEGTQ